MRRLLRTVFLVDLIEGECEGLGPLGAAKKYGFSKQRYFDYKGKA